MAATDGIERYVGFNLVTLGDTSDVIGFSTTENLLYHFMKHGDRAGCADITDYAQLANQMIHARYPEAQDEGGGRYKIRQRGLLVGYFVRGDGRVVITTMY